MRRVLGLAAVGEAATGLALLIGPSLVGRLLLGDALTGVAIPVARVAGIALIALGVACWPGSDSARSPSQAFRAMLFYSLLATLYLAYLGTGGERVGRLLWPAVAIHAILSFVLARAWLKGHRASQ